MISNVVIKIKSVTVLKSESALAQVSFLNCGSHSFFFSFHQENNKKKEKKLIIIDFLYPPCKAHIYKFFALCIWGTEKLKKYVIYLICSIAFVTHYFQQDSVDGLLNVCKELLSLFQELVSITLFSYLLQHQHHHILVHGNPRYSNLLILKIN